MTEAPEETTDETADSNILVVYYSAQEHTKGVAEIDPNDYSLWGGSAGARMAAMLGNSDYLQQLTSRTDIGQAGAVIMQYTGYTYTSKADAPTYVCVGTSDGIAN